MAYEMRERELLTVTTTLQKTYTAVRDSSETFVQLMQDLTRNIAGGDQLARAAVTVLERVNGRRLARTIHELPGPVHGGGDGGSSGNGMTPRGDATAGNSGPSGTGGIGSGGA